jgi:putative lipoic acid-binding regulatory protein
MEPDFEKLRLLLEQNNTFPMVYWFKIIVPDNLQKIARVEHLFSEDAEIERKSSSKGNYLSISAKQVVLNAEEVLIVYKKASEIEGAIIL